MKDYVWYACYGSNMLESRFKKYIDRCDDQSMPVESREYVFPYSIYFGAVSTNWGGGGTAFLDDSNPGRALGRVYKITEEQFNQVKRLEGPKYRKRIDLDDIDGLPVCTFTSEERQNDNSPSLEYFETVSSGMMETFPYLDESSLCYSLASSFLSETVFEVLQTIRTEPHGLSASQVSETVAYSHDDVVLSISKLIELQLIRQDRRTLQFSIESPEAKFYTVNNKRPLIDKLIDYKCNSSNADPYARLGNYTLDNESVVEEETQDPSGSEIEGRRILYYTTRYERSIRNREAAIRIHGTRCQVCGFDFSEVYGEIGRGFIEVHHVVPLYSKNSIVEVNPATDLVCLCSNCHRMIHKAPNGVFTVEELASMIHHR